jgi:2-desacetyl-2-hydroxyethyl bacteriochlorophyllide A dehydrogenase
MAREHSSRLARAVWFPSVGQVEIRDESVPDPGPGEIRVRALASGISQGTELLVLRGQVPPHLSLDLPTLKGGYGFPIKFGYANVGTVVEIGSGVGYPAIGDRVFVHHPHQTEFVVPATSAFRLSPHGEPDTGTLLANLETAVNIVLDAAPRLSETVVVFGQGVVGVLVALVLRGLGTLFVITVEPSCERVRILEDLMPGQLQISRGDIPEQVMQVTDGRGADVAVECSGNPEALNTAIQCLASDGTVVVASWYGTKQAAIQLGGTFHRNRLRLVSSQVGRIDPALGARWDRDRRMRVALELVRELRLEPLVTHRIPFKAAAQAYDLLQESPGTVMQAVLTYGDGDV